MKSEILWGLGAVIAYGFCFWAKIPALLLAPTLLFLTFWQKKRALIEYNRNFLKTAFIILGGFLILALLKVSPLFGQLWSRGGDFLYGFSEVIEMNLSGLLNNLGRNFKNFSIIILKYYGWGFLILPAIDAIYSKKNRRFYCLQLLSALGFIGPIMLIGKVVHARYYLPAFLLLSLMSILAIANLIELIKQKNNLKNFIKVILSIVMFDFILVWISFVPPAWFEPGKINFSKDDKDQYLDSWAAGYGITETVNLIQEKAKSEKILVLTEGYFGTLPDAINMYLFNQDVTNISTEGIGQPVREIPVELNERRLKADATWLVVNANRLQMRLPMENLLAEFCRPDPTMPCLQIWQIDKNLVE